MSRPALAATLALLLAAAATATACRGPEQRVSGVVVAVDGDLEAVRSFTLVTGDGERLTFRPAPGLDRFEHGAPLPHLTEHLRTGDRVRVTYQEDAAGGLTALAVDDAPD